MPLTHHTYLKSPTARWLLATLLLIVILIFLWHHHVTSTKEMARIRKANASRQAPVVVKSAYTRDVPVYLTGLGSVTPTYNVTVKTQIDGQLLKVYFKEGQMVKMGQLLALIDPRPYEAQLIQFQGQLERDQALLANARIDLTRFHALYPIGAVSQQVYATQVALVKQDEGTVKLDEGQLQQVKVNLIYCYIKSPVNGRIGLRLVDPGNFVQTTDTNGLFVVNTLSPITVVFTIPEDYIPEVQQQIDAGQTLKVFAYDRWQNTLLAEGKLLTIDNQIDTTTGTVKLKATFLNEDDKLFASQFVNARLLVKILPKMTVIPTAAIQHGVHNSFVFVLEPNHTVKVVPITTSEVVGDYTTVTKGIKSGQQVVVDGTDKLTDGAKVKLASNTQGNTKKPAQPNKSNHVKTSAARIQAHGVA